MLPGRLQSPLGNSTNLSLRPGRLQPMPPTAPQPSYDLLQAPGQAPVTQHEREPCGYYSPHIPGANPRSSTKTASSSPTRTSERPYRAPVRGGGYTAGGAGVQLVRPVSRQGTGREGHVYGRGPRPETPVSKHPRRATLAQGLETTDPGGTGGRAADSASPPKVVASVLRECFEPELSVVPL